MHSCINCTKQNIFYIFFFFVTKVKKEKDQGLIKESLSASTKSKEDIVGGLTSTITIVNGTKLSQNQHRN